MVIPEKIIRPKAFSYVRMSTDLQLKGDSLRRQREASRRYAETHDLELVEDFDLHDIGVSAYKGKNLASGAFGRFMEAVREGKIERGSYLLVESFDRMSRQEPMKALKPFMEIVEAGLVLVTLDDERVFSGEISFEDLIISIAKMSRANEESARKSDRLAQAWKTKRAGIGQKKLTARCPSWLSLKDDRSGFEVIEDRAVVVRRIFDEAASGIGTYTIVRRLNEDGVPTFTGRGGWQNSTVNKILSGPAAIGNFQPSRMDGGKRVPDGQAVQKYFPRIVSQPVFEAAQRGRLERKTKPDRDRKGSGGPKGKNFTNLFSKLAVCDYCGKPMQYQNKGTPPKGQSYLVCSSALRNLGCEMIGRWRYDQFETTFLSFVERLDLRRSLRLKEWSRRRSVQQISLPKGTPFPTTKEEVLRHFVGAHEMEASRAEAMHAVVQDFHQDYLDGLAVFATRTANTAISDINARRSISDTVALLANNGQINIKPEPNAVLDVLVSNHVLMRAGDTPGVSFQHQQFQEWYASHSVERRIVTEVDDFGGRETLKADIFNFPDWEEAILFAVERMSRGHERHRAACSKAILAAFDVDPVLAAEMIFRSTDDMWARISTPIQSHVARWHAPGKVGRALRFMLMSGRAEFFDLVWPLLTAENEQVSLRALRSCKRFRPSILGKNAAQQIKALPQKLRLVLLHEIASRSGMDGLDLATRIAKDDPEPEVKSSVIDALTFRRADRHVADILRNADEKTFDLVSRWSLIDEIDDEHVRQGIEAARARLAAKKTSVKDRLRLIAYGETHEDDSAELTKIVSTMEIDKKQDGGVMGLLYEAHNRYPRAIADGVLARVRARRNLFNGADDMLASAGFIVEDEELLNFILANPARNDMEADAAASVLGPVGVGAILDRLLALAPNVVTDPAARETYNALEERIGHVPGGSLVTAIVERSPTLNSEQMARFADLLSRHPDGDSDRARPLDADAVRAVQRLVEEWGERMLASSDAERWQKSAIATLASHVPGVGLLPLLKRMNDDNLRRYRDFRNRAEAEGWRHGDALQESRTPYTGEYQRAFLAVKAPQTAVLMRDYLEDEHFGALAARVLADQWRTVNEAPKDGHFLGGIDFSDVQAKRAARAANPAATCGEAEAIFAAIDRLIADGATQRQQMLAVSLGITGLLLPHGQREVTIRKLISIAPSEGYAVARSDLLLSLVLSGEEVEVADVAAGIDETVEAAKTHSWKTEGYGLKVWLRLLPFVSKPIEGLSILRGLLPAQRDPYFLRELLRSYVCAPADAAEEVLFKLAEADPRLYFEHEWRSSVVALDTASSARRLIDLVAGGARDDDGDSWHVARQLGGLLAKHVDLRRHVYSLLKDGAPTPGLAKLAGAVAESPDEDGLLLLVKCEQNGQRFRGWRMIEKTVTEHVPVENYQNAYNVVPIPAVALRRKLVAMTTDGGPKDVAARWLTDIDNVRDEYGMPGGEPRHPDLASGKPWPIMLPDSEATAE